MDSLRSGFALDSLSDDGAFSGYGSIFGNVDSHGDIVAKGAFKDSIDAANATGNWPKLLLEHGAESKMPIGIWLSMFEDDQGLRMDGKLALGNSRARDTLALMKMTPRPALDGLSIGYQATRFKMHERGSKARRTLQAVKLLEVSIVTSPSNPLATVQRVKSANLFRPKLEDSGDKFMRALAALDASRS